MSWSEVNQEMENIEDIVREMDQENPEATADIENILNQEATTDIENILNLETTADTENILNPDDGVNIINFETTADQQDTVSFETADLTVEAQKSHQEASAEGATADKEQFFTFETDDVFATADFQLERKTERSNREFQDPKSLGARPKEYFNIEKETSSQIR